MFCYVNSVNHDLGVLSSHSMGGGYLLPLTRNKIFSEATRPTTQVSGIGSLSLLYMFYQNQILSMTVSLQFNFPTIPPLTYTNKISGFAAGRKKYANMDNGFDLCAASLSLTFTNKYVSNLLLFCFEFTCTLCFKKVMRRQRVQINSKQKRVRILSRLSTSLCNTHVARIK